MNGQERGKNISVSLKDRLRDPEYREKMREVCGYSSYAFEWELWEAARGGLLPQIEETGRVSEKEMEILKEYFDGEGKRPSEDLFDRFSIALARVAGGFEG